MQVSTSLILGIDEVGRGSLCGPVLACCASVDPSIFPKNLSNQIRESKSVSKKHRTTFVETLLKTSPSGFFFSLGNASAEEIDKFNILQATFLAMERAFLNFNNELLPCHTIIVDGNRIPSFLKNKATFLVGGDLQIPSIALASMIAKVSRDTLMEELHLDYPLYGFNKNAGYGTKFHRQALERYGPTPHHRKTFEPVKSLLGQTIVN